jgi:hypothetical protein
MKFHIKPAKPAKNPKNYPDIDHMRKSAKNAIIIKIMSTKSNAIRSFIKDIKKNYKR